MKVMVGCTRFYSKCGNLNNIYSGLNKYNYGVEKIEKQHMNGFSWNDGKLVRHYIPVEVERPYIQIDKLETLMKLMDDVDNCLVIHKDDDFPDRLYVEIYDDYRE